MVPYPGDYCMEYEACRNLSLLCMFGLLEASKHDRHCYWLRAERKKWLSILVVCALCRVSHLVENPGLVITNHTVIYQWKWNLVTAYFGGCGGNVVAENVEIDFPVPGDTTNTTLHANKCCSQQSGTNWAGRHWVSVAKLCFHRKIISWFIVINLRPLPSESPQSWLAAWRS